jgi:guanine deaminase
MDEEYMRLAIEDAYKGIKAGHGGPFGAVIVKNGEVLGVDHNMVLINNDPTQHAEVRAITQVSPKEGTYDLSGCVIYATTEPCPMCFSAIHWARIDRLVFGTYIEDVWKLGFNEMPIPAEQMKELGKCPIEIQGGFLREECLKLLEDWNNMPDKKVY